jgi:hypothetical protein
MLTNWDIYKAREGNWDDLVNKVDNIPEADSGLRTDGADFDRGFLLAGRHYCNIAVYRDSKKINVFYIGLDKDTGRELLEQQLGLKLESINEK